jgi:hypothetical protein
MGRVHGFEVAEDGRETIVAVLSRVGLLGWIHSLLVLLANTYTFFLPLSENMRLNTSPMIAHGTMKNWKN